MLFRSREISFAPLMDSGKCRIPHDSDCRTRLVAWDTAGRNRRRRAATRKGDLVYGGKSGRGGGDMASWVFAVLFAVIVVWLFERVKLLWWRWKASKEDPLWHLRKKR